MRRPGKPTTVNLEDLISRLQRLGYNFEEFEIVPCRVSEKGEAGEPAFLAANENICIYIFVDREETYDDI